MFEGTTYTRTVNNSSLHFCGGPNSDNGGNIYLFGSVNSNQYTAGSIRIITSKNIIYYFEHQSFSSCTPNTTLGEPHYRWGQIYSTNSNISTSDSRLKNTISSIDDSLLDAWETIQPKQYKFNDATESKGEQARFHTGYLAQDIQKACNDNNLDISKYGLFCYDSWEEEPEITEDVEVEKDGVKTTEKRIIQPKREKGDMYALRYEEALVVECAYLRREVSKLKQQNENLEQRLKMLEQSVK